MNILKYFKVNKDNIDQSGKENSPENESTGGKVTNKQVAGALEKVIDPETGVDIVALGLIYGISAVASDVTIKMTMTTPSCPVVGLLMDLSKENVEKIPGVKSAEIELVWEPRWKPAMMSESAKKQLGW